MKISADTKPRLPNHYYVLYEPPDTKGDESLIFVSERRRIKVKGTLFREFMRAVIPLLDGLHTVEEIQSSVSDIFPANEVSAALELLAQQHLLANGAVVFESALATLSPQLNFLHEVSEDPSAIQAALAKATVSIVGLGVAGSIVAANLATTGVGHLRILDSSRVRETDGYFDPVFQNQQSGLTRTSIVCRAIGERTPFTAVVAYEDNLDSEDALQAAIGGSDLVVCCADRGQASIFYKLNRAAMKSRIPWISCSVSGFEIVVGPAVRPHETPCYLCYTMRSVACAENPEDDFSLHRFLDHRRRDDGDRRENLVFTVGMAANLLGLEALKMLTGFASCATAGAVLVMDAIETTLKKHVVLQHPRCPVCFGEPKAVDTPVSDAVDQPVLVEQSASAST